MINLFTQPMVFIFIIFSSLFATEEILWDLGVVINSHGSKTYQQELSLDELYLDSHNKNDQIKALYSHNFIAPILYEIKNPVHNSFDIIKTYDNFLGYLSITEKANILKSAFLNKKYWKFFSLHSFIENNTENPKQVDEMYIQNLYYTKKTDEALDYLNDIEDQNLTDLLMYYKIKLFIQNKSYKKADKYINLFITQHSNSDLLYYVKYEKKIIEIKHEK